MNVWMLTEEFFKDLADFLQVQRSSSNNKKLIENVISACELDSEWNVFFTIIRLVRNGLHRNGVHTSSTEEGVYTWREKHAEFKNGKRIESWVIHEDFLVKELNETMVELFCALFSSPALKEASHIPRLYCGDVFKPQTSASNSS